MKYPPRQGNFFEQQVSISSSHLHSVYTSQKGFRPLQAKVTAMETKTTKRTFIIIPCLNNILFLSVFWRCVDFNIDADIICETTYTFLYSDTSEDNNGICESLSLSFCDLFQLILWLYLLNARNIIILKSHTGTTAPPFMDVTLKIF